jgi:hypothetical protein
MLTLNLSPEQNATYCAQCVPSVHLPNICCLHLGLAAIAVKEKLESLCREFQRQNKMLKVCLECLNHESTWILNVCSTVIPFEHLCIRMSAERCQQRDRTCVWSCPKNLIML